MLQHAATLFRLESEIPLAFEPVLQEALTKSGAQYQIVDCQWSYNRIANMSGLLWSLFDNDNDLKLLLEQLLQAVNYQPNVPFDGYVDSLMKEILSLKIAFRTPLKCKAARYKVNNGRQPEIYHWSVDESVVHQM